jgi:hypothetical protein
VLQVGRDNSLYVCSMDDITQLEEALESHRCDAKMGM